jgi:ABC-2 type transport system ATP-binding protein
VEVDMLRTDLHETGRVERDTYNTVIETNDLSKSFGETVALKSLNLRVPKNSIFGFLGPNGAGKTTTIKLLLGLIRPTDGGGTVFSHDITKSSVKVRRRIGYLAQVPSYYTHMTAREILRFKIHFYYTGPRYKIEERIEEILEIVELDDKADRPIKGFSGGEHQRLGIAQAQVHHPDLLILDEPAANLDPMGRRDVLGIMERLREHATIFYSTHILDDVQRVSDTVAILNHGELVAQAPIEELLMGSSGTAYSITFKRGYDEAQRIISEQDWVSGVTVVHGDNRTTLQVVVKDEEVAEDDLLNLAICDGKATVTEFGRRQYKLEDIFVEIVEGSNNGR